MLVSGQVEYCNHNNIICTLYKRDFLSLDVLVWKKLKCLYTRNCMYIQNKYLKEKNIVSCMHVKCNVYKDTGRKMEFLLVRRLE